MKVKGMFCACRGGDVQRPELRIETAAPRKRPGNALERRLGQSAAMQEGEVVPAGEMIP